MGVLGEPLFYRRDQVDLDAVLRHNGAQLRDVVDRIPEREFSSKTDGQIAAEIAEQQKITPLEIHLDQATPHVEETRVEVRNDFHFGRNASVAGLKATKAIPFTGDSQLWALRTNPFDLNPPRAVVQGGRLIIGIEVPAQQADEAKRYIDDAIARLPQYLEWQRAQIEGYNKGLASQAMPWIQQRRARLCQADDLLKKLQ
jgi:hypothetical protein